MNSHAAERVKRVKAMGNVGRDLYRGAVGAISTVKHSDQARPAH